MTKISIVIPTFNRAESLSRSIESVIGQTLDAEDYEIVIVDDNSKDETQTIAENFVQQFPGFVRYLRTKHAGLHQARHVGAIAAKAEILAYTDDDAVCDEYWVEELLSAYDNHDIGCAGGKTAVKWDGKPPDWFIPHEAFLAKLDYGPGFRTLTPSESIYGVNFSIKKHVLCKVGGFHPDLINGQRVGDGEIGLCKALHNNDISIGWVPTAIVQHVKSVSDFGTERYLKRSLAHLAVSNLYAQFLNGIPSKPLLLSHSVKALSFCGAHKAIALFKRGNFESRLQHEVCGAYQKAAGIYTWQLIYKQGLRELIRRRNWCEYARSVEDVSESEPYNELSDLH